MTVAMKQGTSNSPSKLLSGGENSALFALLGAKCQSMCSSVIQLFLTHAPDHTQWRRHDAGVICFVKDHVRRSYFFRLYCLSRGSLLWEQEVYADMEYFAPKPWLHTFEAESSMAALNFASEDEANIFKNIVTRQLENKRQRRVERKRQSMGEVKGSLPNLPGAVHRGAINGPPSSRNHHRSASSGATSKTKESKKKLKKEDIGIPQNFRHVSHVGWDHNKGFDVDLSQIEDPNLKKFFEKAGVSASQLQDRTTRDFIYDFIEKNGGLDAVKDEVVPPLLTSASAMRAPPVPSRTPPPPAQHKTAPPPPSITRACPPTPVTQQRNAPPPPPPPSAKPTNQSTTSAAPPPPPPPPMTGPTPPPPPMAMSTPAAPPVAAPADPRSELMAAIKSGRALKHVEVEKKLAPTDSRGDLLSQIRQGVELKSVPQTERQSASEPSEGLAGALARALAERSRAFHDSDSDSDSGSNADSEWDE